MILLIGLGILLGFLVTFMFKFVIYICDLSLKDSDNDPPTW